jgi:D-glycero-alpha-D-manno-heptose-7-phosphate kinase
MTRSFEATAPTRADLAGGTLDLWPLYLFHPGAVTVNAALDRRAWCRVTIGAPGVLIESKDTLRRWQAGSVAELLEAPQPPLAAFVLDALGIATDVKVATQSRVPAGSGLGGSSALAVTIAAAAAAATSRTLTRDELCALVRDAEARAIGVPTGVQDYLAALHGGVLGIRLEPGALRTARLATDPGLLEERLLLVDAGVTRFSGLNNWEVFKAQVDGDAGVRAALHEIAAAGREVAIALEAGRHSDLPALIDREWQARQRLAPGVSTPEIERIVALARESGGAGKVCGAGGGGAVLCLVEVERRAGLEQQLVKEGFKPLAARLDLLGLEVEEVAP